MFPKLRGRGSYYLGGAHGTLGVIYQIVQACLLDSTIMSEHPEVAIVLKQTLDDTLK